MTANTRETTDRDASAVAAAPKRVELARADAWVRRALHGHSAVGPKVFVYPLGRDLATYERRRMLEESILAPDEYATFAVVRELMRRCLHVPRPEDADLVFVPVHVAAYETDGPFELGDVMACVETLSSGLPHILCSIGDYQPRRPGRHINPHSISGDPQNPWARKYAGEYDWLDDRFILISPESTLDLSPNDVGTPVLIRRRPVRPDARRRPLDFSFAGALGYTRARPGHVRGPEAMPHWERLMAKNASGRSFVGTQAMLTATFGAAMTARALPERSRFTLCPAGWGRWTFRLSEAVLAGSIPVILSDFYLKPFGRALAWDTFSVTVPESSLNDVDRIVADLSPERVRWLQRNLAAHQHHFTALGLARLIASELADRAASLSAALPKCEGI